jgi:peroxiredoxin Q/BCP
LVGPGEVAPDFNLRDQDGREVSLEELEGRTVVLFFYPKADTPGCTIQACGVRDRSRDYERADAVVLGVSPDPVEELRAFDEKFGLGFRLLSDADHSTAEAYGVWVEKEEDGRRWWGNERTTFVIGPDRIVLQVFPRVDAREHDVLVLSVLGGDPVRRTQR